MISLSVTRVVGVNGVRNFSLVASDVQCGSTAQPIITDDFNHNSLDTTKWVGNDLLSGFTDLNVPLNETGQRLETAPATALDHAHGLCATASPGLQPVPEFSRATLEDSA